MIVADTLAKVQAGDQTGATARITDLETAWDDDATALQALDGPGWDVLDGQVDRRSLRYERQTRLCDRDADPHHTADHPGAVVDFVMTTANGLPAAMLIAAVVIPVSVAPG